MRLIDADALLINAEQYRLGRGEYSRMVDVWHIENAPTIGTASLRPKSFWEEFETSSFYGYDDNHEPKWAARKFYRCERCRKGTAIKSKFCPCCGSDMSGEPR